MHDCIEIHWSSSSLDEARKISRFLVQERYVASAEIVPWVEAISLLNRQLETTQLSKIILKTRAENFDAIQQVILKNSSYEIPEILVFRVHAGDAAYLRWIDENSIAIAAASKDNQH